MGIRNIGHQKYRATEMLGIRNIRHQKYWASEISGIRNIGHQKYWASKISGIRNIRHQKYRVSEISVRFSEKLSEKVLKVKFHLKLLLFIIYLLLTKPRYVFVFRSFDQSRSKNIKTISYFFAKSNIFLV